MDITTKSAEAQTTLRAVKSRLATMSSKKSRRGPSAQFFRHLAEMYGAMVLGMVILGPLYQLLMRGLGIRIRRRPCPSCLHSWRPSA